jgi:predicted nucleic acid-binding protein
LKEVLDTRFLIELFFSADAQALERARVKLRDLRRRREGVVPTLVLVEFFDQACRRAGKRKASEACDAILASGLESGPLTPAIARTAGGLRCRHRTVPIADCVVAATAAELDGRVVSDDPHFGELGVRVAWL